MGPDFVELINGTKFDGWILASSVVVVKKKL